MERSPIKAASESDVPPASEETLDFDDDTLRAFMERSPIKASSESVVTPAAEETLDFDDDTLRAIAEVYKNEGNDEYRKKDFSNAIYFYTDGIKVNCKDDELKAKLYSNRAIAHFYLGNYNDSLSDAKVATDLQPSCVKAIVRGASACVQLNQFKEAITWCDKGLAIDKNNQKLLELRNRSVKEQRKLQDTDTEKKTSAHIRDRAEKISASGNLGSIDSHIQRDINRSEYHLKLAKQTGDLVAELNAYGHLGEKYFRLGDFKTAKDYFEHWLKLGKQVRNETVVGYAYSYLGSAHQSLGDFKTAIDYCERSLNIAKELGDRSTEGIAYGNLGNAHQSLGDFKTSIDYYERCLNIAKKLGDRSTEGKSYCNLGNTHELLGDFKTAIDYFDRTLNIAKELGDRSTEGKTYGNLGIAHQSLGDFKTAIDYFDRTLNIAKELGDRSSEGKTYCNLGNAHYSPGDFKTAIDYHERSLNIAKELGERSTEGKVYGNLGRTHQSLGDFKTAMDYYERCLNIAKKLGDRSTEGTSYCNIGNTHECLGDFKTAIDYLERSLNIAKELGDRSGEGKAYGNLGRAHKSLEDFKTAIDYYERSLNTAKELGDRWTEGEAYGDLGMAHQSLGEFKTAIDYLEHYLKIAKELGDGIGMAISSHYLGVCFESLGSVCEALECYQYSVTKFNDIRDRLQLNDKWKISLRNRYEVAYACLWRLLLKQGKVMEALFTAEQGRAQALKDLLKLNYAFETSESASGTGNITIHELLSYLPPNTIFIAIGEKELIFWVCQKGKNIELRRKQVSLAVDVTPFLQIVIENAGHEIGARDDVKCEDRSFDMTKDEKPEAERSPPDSKQTQSLNLQKSALGFLYDTIIDPIQDLLLGSELIFVPEGPLCLAPFAALMGTNSKYLCESFRIRVIPSLTSLKLIADCPADYHSKSGSLLVGDPWVQEVTKQPQLPCAREEVEMIGEMLGSMPLIGRQATKDEVLRRLCSVALVHIAAHGNMDTGEIALAPKTGEVDYILTMRDVLRVQMRARLVVLSCCHSAHGEIKPEGVVGIARAFLGAGARSVLVSLWAIDDAATLEFMKRFYQHLVKGKSTSEALNQAMNSMIESDEFCAVKFWAPFVLIGDDVTLEFGGSE